MLERERVAFTTPTRGCTGRLCTTYNHGKHHDTVTILTSVNWNEGSEPQGTDRPTRNDRNSWIRGLLRAVISNSPDTWVYRASLHLGIELLVALYSHVSGLLVNARGTIPWMRSATTKTITLSRDCLQPETGHRLTRLMTIACDSFSFRCCSGSAAALIYTTSGEIPIFSDIELNP